MIAERENGATFSGQVAVLLQRYAAPITGVLPARRGRSRLIAGVTALSGTDRFRAGPDTPSETKLLRLTDMG